MTTCIFVRESTTPDRLPAANGDSHVASEMCYDHLKLESFEQLVIRDDDGIEPKAAKQSEDAEKAPADDKISTE